MSTPKSHILLKEIALQNNCPECYSQEGLRLRFYQRFANSALVKRLTNEVSNTIVCEKCNTTIYPVQWTEDIERVHAYYTKLVKGRKASFKLTKLAYMLILLLVLALVAGVLYFTDQLPF